MGIISPLVLCSPPAPWLCRWARLFAGMCYNLIGVDSQLRFSRLFLFLPSFAIVERQNEFALRGRPVDGDRIVKIEVNACLLSTPVQRNVSPPPLLQ